MKEEWRHIVGTNCSVSNTGKVRQTVSKKIRVISYNSDGYGNIKLSFFKNKIRKNYRVNRLVWETFVGPIPAGYHIDHINKNRADNNLTNLRLLKAEENIAHGDHTGKRRFSKIAQYDLDDNLIGIYESAASAARVVGGTKCNIIKCCKHIINKYKDCRWEYYELD